jgi:hypothetical protein
MTTDAPNRRFRHLFAVARVDDTAESAPVDERISLVSAFDSRDAAEREVARLQDLAGAKKWRYVIMITRLKPADGAGK